jgi:hypothetical protein
LTLLLLLAGIDVVRVAESRCAKFANDCGEPGIKQGLTQPVYKESFFQAAFLARVKTFKKAPSGMSLYNNDLP